MPNSGPDISGDDIWTAARTVYGEGRGETLDGKIAIAHVLLNRLAIARAYKLKAGKQHPNFGDGTLTAVCRDPEDFSCWNAGDSNRKILDDLTLPASLGDAVFRDCLAVTLDAVAGRSPDRTVGSTHYHTIDRGWPKAWGPPQKPVCTIGHHVFYNTVR